jgi:hypothetical protein
VKPAAGHIAIWWTGVLFIEIGELTEQKDVVQAYAALVGNAIGAVMSGLLATGAALLVFHLERGADRRQSQQEKRELSEAAFGELARYQIPAWFSHINGLLRTSEKFPAVPLARILAHVVRTPFPIEDHMRNEIAVRLHVQARALRSFEDNAAALTMIVAHIVKLNSLSIRGSELSEVSVVDDATSRFFRILIAFGDSATGFIHTLDWLDGREKLIGQTSQVTIEMIRFLPGAKTEAPAQFERVKD